MLEKAVRICDAKFGSILRWDNEAAHLVATHNAPPAFAEARRSSINPANPKTSFGRMVATKAVVHVADAAAEPGYIEQHDPAAVAAVELGGQRTALYCPHAKGDRIGRCEFLTNSICLSVNGRTSWRDRVNVATGIEAKTIHRLLEVDPRTGGFRRGEDNPLGDALKEKKFDGDFNSA
jgi:hypothetical protein